MHQLLLFLVIFIPKYKRF